MALFLFYTAAVTATFSIVMDLLRSRAGAVIDLSQITDI